MKPHLPLLKRGGKKTPEKNVRRLQMDLRRAGLAVGTIIILSAFLSIHMLPSKVSLKLGDVAAEDIVAQRTQRYSDTTETELKRNQATNSAGRVYDPVPKASDQAIGALTTILRTVEFARQNWGELSASAKVGRIRERLGALLGSQISNQTLITLLATLPDDFMADGRDDGPAQERESF